MASFQGLQGLGAPINYYDMIPDFRREALLETQNMLGQQQLVGQQMQNQQAIQENQRRDAFYNAISSATPDQLPALRRQFPEFAQNIQQEIGIQGSEHAAFVNRALNKLSVAASSGDASQVQAAIQQNAPALASLGVSPDQASQLFQQSPQQFNSLLNATRMATMPVDKQFDVQQKQQQLDETARSNKAGESIQIRGQDISASTARRGQDISAQNSMRSAGGATPASVREYQYFNSLSPEQQQTYLRVRGRPDTGGDNTVQLADGRTVTVSGKLHGAGASAFYEGKDDAGNMVRVPASAVAAPPTSAASAQNYAMKKDIDSIQNASSSDLDFMTGLTGRSGSPTWTADVRSRLGGKDQRMLFNAAQRIQGRMQNQGIAAAKDMGASGINTVPEAKMYFQSMPQIDYSSPDALQQSIRDIQQYTDQYNQQYNVNIGGGKQSQPTQQTSQPQQASGYSSLWGD
jgi:hypothetical protein